MKQSEIRKKTDPAALGKELAEKFQIEKRSGYKRLATTGKRWLLFVRAVFVRSSRIMENKTLPEPFEWLCDNYYIIEQAAKSAIRDSAKIQKLPATMLNGKRVPVMYAAVSELISRRGYILTGYTVMRFLNGLQAKRPLELAEIKGFACAMKLALLDTTANIAYELNSAIDTSKNKTEQILTPERSHELAEMMSDIINDIKFLEQLDFDKLLSRVSQAEAYLLKDPAGVYDKMQLGSKSYYRERVSFLAEKQHISETDVARNAVESAEKAKTEKEKHVGFWLFADLEKERLGLRAGYIFLLIALPLITAVLCSIIMPWWLAAILYFPVFESVKALLDYLFTRFMTPSHMPRLNLSKGIPDSGRTLAVISALITDGKKAEHFVDRLEKFYYANPDSNLILGVLADLPDSDEKYSKTDKEIIDGLAEGVDRLNKKLGSHFAAFIRERSLNEKQKKYMAWERKRGAIVELASFLGGEKSRINVLGGNLDNLHSCKYLITVDADTDLLMDSARDMISTMMHPLCRGEVSGGRVQKGYGILTPCIETDIEAVSRTTFSRLTSGLGGVDSYGGAVGDLYQDLFGEGIFTGKGIIDLDLFREVMSSALPENRILSHDILEGGFLRAGFLSDVKLTDGYPAAVSSYIDRLHRWIRGDVQNAAWILPKVRNAEGKKVRNPLGGLTRFKLIDNVRRPLTPVFTIIALFAASLIPKGAYIATILALFWLMLPILIALIEGLINGGLSQIFCIYYSKNLGGVKGAAASALLWLNILPYLARTAVDAFARSIWRVIVSKRLLLSWVTADQSEIKNKNGIEAYLKRMWPDSLLGLILIILPTAWPMKLLALFWMMSPLLAWNITKPQVNEVTKITEDEQRLVKGFCQDMWKFFDENRTEKTLYLPPDNIQEKPVYRVAMRTSPTNIGLGLLCCLAARDFGFIDSRQLYDKLKHIFDSLDKLEKWHGHLLNWYNLEDGSPLHPKYVSSVDSGNFCASLYTLRSGLRQYRDDCPELTEFEVRIRNYTENVDWKGLYCRRRNLFHIGYDVTAGKREGIYDLFMSESRITSFITIASHAVPKKHWASISRPLVRKGNRIGFASWTGTMFEYFMPHLFMPIYKSSAAFEAMRFALTAQVNKGRQFGIPWGISESGYYAFDPMYNYQYKAFGVQTLGFKRGLDDERVISPYSSFLALILFPRRALENLKLLYKRGYYGKYGFYEAIDYTPERVGKGFGLVRSFMSHHIGMSMIAASNFCMDNIMQKRFMREPSMRAATELLKERVPSGAVIHDKISIKQPPMRLSKDAFYNAKVQIKNPDPSKPRAHVLANGEVSMVFSDSGSGYIKSGEINLTQFKKTGIEHPQGVFAIATDGNCAVSATTLPLSATSAKHECLFEAGKITYTGMGGSLMLRQSMSVDCDMEGSIFRFTVQNMESVSKSVKLMVYLEPCLAPLEDMLSHPAFSKLFIESFYDEPTGAVLFRRRPRKPNDIEKWMCICCSDKNFSFETRRDKALERMKGLSCLLEPKQIHLEGFTGACVDPCILAAFPFHIPSKGSISVEMAVADGNSREEAVEGAVKLLSSGFARVSADYAKGLEIVRSHMGLGGSDEKLMTDILASVAFGADFKKEADPAVLKKGQSALWSYSISGDIPIVLLRITNMENIFKTATFIRCHRYLSFCGVEFDLVIVYDESEGYQSPMAGALKQIIRLCSSTNMVKQRGGVFPIDSSALAEGDLELITFLASYYWEDSEEYELNEKQPEDRDEEESIQLVPPAKKVQGKVKLSFDGEDAVIEGMPKLPWCHVMTNCYFGSLVSDKSLGFTWAFNARENKLTPWDNDIIADNNGERLMLSINGGEYDICASADKTVYNEASALYLTSLAGTILTTHCFVDAKLPLKYISVDITSEKEISASVSYSILPVMGVSRRMNCFIESEKYGDMMLFRNNYNTDYRDQQGFLWCREGDFEYRENSIFSRPEWVSRGKSVSLKPGKSERIVFILGYAKSKQMLDMLSRRIPETDIEKAYEEAISNTRSILNRVQIHTPDENLNRLFNRWLPLQTMKSRMFARTGFYQCGGAFGFRDQLQDSFTAGIYDDDLLKRQIVRACKHQFPEGDVQHWWHPIFTSADKGHKGVRTRCSDDLLWLPYGICEYIERTGDISILEIDAEYIESRMLTDSEHERYETPVKSNVHESVYRHAVRALDKAYQLGSHGLPLFGSGDWNDGMNLVGEKGRGESVWLAMFMRVVFERFQKIAEKANDPDTVRRCAERSEQLKKSLESAAWDGEWYKRGFYDDGAPLGSKDSEECKIDSIPQSFSAFAKLDGDRVKTALDKAYSLLVDKDMRIVKLFTPPFDHAKENPGYIKGYLPGVRENGGQYTHAAVWLALALLQTGENEKGYELLSLINPMNNASGDAVEYYKAEPYVIAADVYSNPSQPGRGGWSWYTGAAGWYTRTVLEELLGIKIIYGQLAVSPRIPKAWDGFDADLAYKGAVLHISVKRKGDSGKLKLFVNDSETAFPYQIPESGEINIRVEMS